MFHMLDNLLFMAKYKLNAFLRDEEGDVNIVSIVVLIGIAVLLAIIFRKEITKLITTMLNTITNNAINAVNGSE
ncbi:MAG: flagellin-like protein [Acetatifactor sp.]|nr:flagellin-like protein [Acetatifactor sp.]